MSKNHWLRYCIYYCVIIITVGGIFLSCGSKNPELNVSENSITIAWNENTESDLAGYRIYYGTSSGVYENSIDAGNTNSYTIKDLSPGVTYYIAVTAYDGSGNESGFSDEVSGQIK